MSLQQRLTRLEATAGSDSAALTVAAAELALALGMPVADARWRLVNWLWPWAQQCADHAPPERPEGRARLAHALAGGVGLTAPWVLATMPVLGEPCTDRGAFTLRVACELALSLAEADRQHAAAVARGAYLRPCPECGEPEAGYGWCNTRMVPWSAAAHFDIPPGGG